MTGIRCSHCAQPVITGLDQLGGVTIDLVPGGTFALYVAGYSAFRILEETLRIDSSEHFLGLRLNFYIAGALTPAGIAWFVCSQRRGKRAAQRTALLATGAVLAAAAAGCGQTAHTAQAASAQHPPAIAGHPHANKHG